MLLDEHKQLAPKVRRNRQGFESPEKLAISKTILDYVLQHNEGVLTSDAVSSLSIYPYQLFFPAAAISLTILAFNFLGDGLRDALDPRLRK